MTPLLKTLIKIFDKHASVTAKGFQPLMTKDDFIKGAKEYEKFKRTISKPNTDKLHDSKGSDKN